MALINQNFLRFQKPINLNQRLDVNIANEATAENGITIAGSANKVNIPSGTNNINEEEKKQILQEVKTALKEESEKWGFNNWKLTDEQIENLYNKLISDSSITSFNGTKEDFENLIKMKLTVLYKEILSIGIWNDFNFISKTDDSKTDEVTPKETLQTYEEKINSDEFNKEVTKEEATAYINQYVEFIKAELKEKYNYSDSYIDNIISVVLDNIFKQGANNATGGLINRNPFGQNQDTENYNLQTILKQFKSEITNLLKEPKLEFFSGYKGINLFAGNISPFSTQMLEAFSKNSNLQLQLLSKLFTSVIQEKGFNEDEANAFISLVFRSCVAKINNSLGDLSLTMDDLKKLDRNGDGSWFDELSNTINNVARRYSHMEQDAIDNAQTIDTQQFLRDFATHSLTDYSMVEKLVMQLDSMMLSNDPAMRKLAQMLDKAFEKYDCKKDEDKKDLVKMLLMLLGQKSGDTIDTRKFYLTKDNIEQLNQNDIFGQIQEILDDYSNWSMVHNDYHQGDTYYIKRDGNIYTIINTDTLKETVVDLNKLVEKLPDDKKEEALKSLRQIPAEALIDMWYESTFIDGSTKGTGGTYHYDEDTIHLNSYEATTMIHETGHAMADTILGDFSRSKEFEAIFSAELAHYIADGQTPVIEHYTSDGTYDPWGLEPLTNSNYCTMNAQEMFAECYTLLMLGSYKAAWIITEYFPQSLNKVKEYVDQIRNMKAENRRN